ncbi:MAG: tRNA pseudouridine(38-40) synthase TruA [Enterobacterales bacterium]
MKLALGIEYNGSLYYGWQKQNKLPNIQDQLETAISIIANSKTKVFCAGRTDSGVHATGQVIHFITKKHRLISEWTKGINFYLPNDITVLWVIQVKKNFHARFSAIYRRYRYIIYNNESRPAIFKNGITHVKNYLDEKKMLRSSKCLLGEHDFSAFRSSQCQSISAYRKIYYFNIIRQNKYIIFDIKASSFLHNMVRIIIGSLIEVGSGKKSELWIHNILKQRKRVLSGVTAPSNGLYLVDVKYPSCFLIPKSNIGPIFLNI